MNFFFFRFLSLSAPSSSFINHPLAKVNRTLCNHLNAYARVLSSSCLFDKFIHNVDNKRSLTIIGHRQGHAFTRIVIRDFIRTSNEWTFGQTHISKQRKRTPADDIELKVIGKEREMIFFLLQRCYLFIIRCQRSFFFLLVVVVFANQYVEYLHISIFSIWKDKISDRFSSKRISFLREKSSRILFWEYPDDNTRFLFDFFLFSFFPFAFIQKAKQGENDFLFIRKK